MLLQKLSGYVIKIADGIATLTLNQANNLKIKYGEMILFETRLLNTQNKAYPLYGQILNIDGENSTVKAIIFGDDRLLSVGNKYFGLNQPLAIDPRKFFFGGYYDAFGNCLNSKTFRQIMQTLYYSIDQISRVYPYSIQNNKNSLIKSIDIIPIGLIKRQPIDTPVITGIKIIDGLFPIGRGQRELILGDRRSGKTAIALDMIQNQKRLEVNNEAMKSIYVGIGQKASSIADVIRKGVFFNFKDTIYICATASYPAPFLYVTPYAGCTLGEYFRDLGLHSLLIFDDLTKQAIAYRQLSLLLKRTPGREAYPGDIFYLHSRLLERAAYLVPELGAGSLTIIPVIETQAGDMTGYIPTNVISITDGQLFLETSLFYSGFRPAINIGLSVSRVGSKAQFNIVKKYTASLKLELSLFKELEVFTKMEESLDPVTEKILHRGKRILTILLQYPTYPLNVFQEFLIFYCGVQGHLDKLSTDNFEIQKFEYSLLKNPFNSLVPLLNYLDFFFLYYQK
jgi:F-type H+-transporting ATPase subunit alpha